MAEFDVTIKILSPIHLGSGQADVNVGQMLILIPQLLQKFFRVVLPALKNPAQFFDFVVRHH